jgi:hypothetical protein
MKIINLTLILLLAGVTVVMGQQNRGAAGGAQHFIMQHGEELGLTEEQKEAMLTAAMDRRSEMRRAGYRTQGQRGALNRNRPGSERGARTEGRQQFSPVYLEVLTQEQLGKLQEIRTERAQDRLEVQKIRNRVIAERAGIEAGKKDELIELLNRQSEIMAGMQMHTARTGEVTDRDEIRQQRRDQLNELRENRDQVKNLLTAAEYEKLQQQMAPVRQQPRRVQLRRR